MKKCPKCNADIEDNARFCVFCMSSLQKKQKIKTKSKAKWPIFAAIGGFTAIGGIVLIIIVSLLVALLVIISMLFLGKSKTNNNSSLSYISEQIFASDDAYIVGNDENIVGKDDNENTKDTTTQNDETTDTSDKKIGDDGVSSGTSSTASSSKDDTSDSKIEEDSSSQSEPTQIPSKTEAVYTYRNAVAADCYTPGNIPAQPISDVIVITGVKTPSSSGVYTIPETIDGKRVGAIMPYAFCDANISSTVKKVVVPSSVKTIWQDAFSNCYNLTDIYIMGQTIDIIETAFPNTSSRTGTLTIHCSHYCKTFGFYYYRNIASNYGATYKEWNGGNVQ